MRSSSLLLGALGALFAVGCGHVETHQAMLRPPAPPLSRPADLYMMDQPLPTAPFYEIALVQAVGFGSDSHPEEVAQALAEKAASLGCDAVLRTAIDQGYSRTNATGVCIQWLGPAPATSPAALPPSRGANPPPPSTRPTPAPRIEPLPSAGPGQGGGR